MLELERRGGDEHESQCSKTRRASTATSRTGTSKAVKDMNQMFQDATSFNGDISAWNIQAVTDMANMFNNARAFARDITGWNAAAIAAARDARKVFGMFKNATAWRAIYTNTQTSYFSANDGPPHLWTAGAAAAGGAAAPPLPAPPSQTSPSGASPSSPSRSRSPRSRPSSSSRARCARPRFSFPPRGGPRASERAVGATSTSTQLFIHAINIHTPH
jgi:surface protein